MMKKRSTGGKRSLETERKSQSELCEAKAKTIIWNPKASRPRFYGERISMFPNKNRQLVH